MDPDLLLFFPESHKSIQNRTYLSQPFDSCKKITSPPPFPSTFSLTESTGFLPAELSPPASKEYYVRSVVGHSYRSTCFAVECTVNLLYGLAGGREGDRRVSRNWRTGVQHQKKYPSRNTRPCKTLVHCAQVSRPFACCLGLACHTRQPWSALSPFFFVSLTHEPASCAVRSERNPTRVHSQPNPCTSRRRPLPGSDSAFDCAGLPDDGIFLRHATAEHGDVFCERQGGHIVKRSIFATNPAA